MNRNVVFSLIFYLPTSCQNENSYTHSDFWKM